VVWRCGRWNQGATGSIGFVSSVTCFSSMGSSGVTQSAKGTLELPHGITLTKRGGYRFSAASRIVCGGIQLRFFIHGSKEFICLHRLSNTPGFRTFL
jgi:hypothetical protein